MCFMMAACPEISSLLSCRGCEAVVLFYRHGILIITVYFGPYGFTCREWENTDQLNRLCITE